MRGYGERSTNATGYHKTCQTIQGSPKPASFPSVTPEETGMVAGRYLRWRSIPAKQGYPLFLLVDEQEGDDDGEAYHHGNHDRGYAVQRRLFHQVPPVVISVFDLEVTHI